MKIFDKQRYIDEHCDMVEASGNEDYEVCGECGEDLSVCPKCRKLYCPYCDKMATKEHCGGCNYNEDDDYWGDPGDSNDYKELK